MHYKRMIEITEIADSIVYLFQEIPFLILLIAYDMLLVAVGSATKVNYLPLFTLIINILGIGAQAGYSSK